MDGCRSWVLAGVVLSLSLRQALRHWLTGAFSGEIAPLVVALGVLVFAAVVASSIPAMRATRVQPVEALRYE